MYHARINNEYVRCLVVLTEVKNKIICSANKCRELEQWISNEKERLEQSNSYLFDFCNICEKLVGTLHPTIEMRST